MEQIKVSSLYLGSLKACWQVECSSLLSVGPLVEVQACSAKPCGLQHAAWKIGRKTLVTRYLAQWTIQVLVWANFSKARLLQHKRVVSKCEAQAAVHLTVARNLSRQQRTT